MEESHVKRLSGWLLLAVFVAAGGWMISLNTVSAAPPSCGTYCNPAKCVLKGGACVKTGPNCYVCQIL
jgi:hypothetical protein